MQSRQRGRGQGVHRSQRLILFFNSPPENEHKQRVRFPCVQQRRNGAKDFKKATEKREIEAKLGDRMKGHR